MDRNIMQNINAIINVKNDLRSLLILLDKQPTEEFDTYANLFREKISEINELATQIVGL